MCLPGASEALFHLGDGQWGPCLRNEGLEAQQAQEIVPVTQPAPGRSRTQACDLKLHPPGNKDLASATGLLGAVPTQILHAFCFLFPEKFLLHVK